ncbi:MAG: hypothetical protein DI570_15315 [Phenylobacterium zucineum]|nr:MAG: hypothetical protein DI570_15315 [Phenylobacterium zucineum]
MSLGLTHTGAIARGLAYTPAPTLVAPPAPTAAKLAEGGVDPLSLYKMSSQDRIRTEAALIVQDAKQQLVAQNQQRADIRATGVFLDIRV